MSRKPSRKSDAGAGRVPACRTLKDDFEPKYGKGRIAALEAALEATARTRHRVNLELASPTNSLHFGVIGDTHFGSIYEAMDQLSAMYSRFAAVGIKDVFHAGDVLDGHRVYAGHEFEIHGHGWAKQRDWFAAQAPRVSGITTHFITGNHDASLKRAAGIDVGPELTHLRTDWHFLGEDHATVVFHTPNGRAYRVGLIHPDGGSAFSLSYRPQRITEQLEGGNKPNLLLIAHYHKAEFMPCYRNVAVLQVGCFQWQTPYLVRKASAAHVGGWEVLVTVQPDESLSNSIRAEFTAFYAEMAK